MAIEASEPGIMQPNRRARVAPPRSGSAMGWLEAISWSSLGIATFIAVWTLAPIFGLVPYAFVTSPAEVFRTAVSQLTNTEQFGPSLYTHALASLQKLSLSYALAVICGVPLGLLIGRYKYIDWLVSPIFDAIRFVPPIAWVPFSILWFGTGLLAPTMIVFIAAFAPCVINASRGVQLINPVLIEASRTLGTSPALSFWRVLLPGASTQIIAGMRIGAGLGWQSLVGAELIVGNTGLGYAMTQSVQNLDASSLIVCMLTIGATGGLIDYLLAYLDKKTRIWRGVP